MGPNGTDPDRRPEPLVPAEVDLHGFHGFMLNIDKLLASELVALGNSEECWAALMLWCRAWKQTPAASLPNDDKILASFSGAGRRWPKVKAMAMRGFVLCNDGRFYHRVLAVEAIAAWERRVEHREEISDKSKRQQRWRERKKALSARLRELGVTPPGDASYETLEGMVVDAEKRLHKSNGVDADVDAKKCLQASTVGVSETCGTGTGTGTGTEERKKESEDGADAPPPVVELKSARARGPLAYENGVIRLNAKDFDRWKKAFAHIPLEAELESLARWAAEQENWFFAVSGALKNREREALERIQAKDKPDPRGEYGVDRW